MSWKHFLLSSAVAVIAANAAAPTVLAHAKIQTTSVAEGATLRSTPASVDITLSEPAIISALHLRDGAGKDIALHFHPAAETSASFALPLPKLASGTYRLSWQMVAENGHVTEGDLGFSIGSTLDRVKASPAPATRSEAAAKSHRAHADHNEHAAHGEHAEQEERVQIAPHIEHKDDGSAHSAGMTITSSIVDGATLTSPPSSVRLQFGHPVRLTNLRLSTITGEAIPVKFDAKAGPRTSAEVSFEALSPDSYILTFGGDAGDHTMGGTIRFKVR